MIEGMNDTYLRLNDAAARLGVSTGALRNWFDAGEIRGIRLPGGERRIAASEVDRLRDVAQRAAQSQDGASGDT